MKKKCRKVMVNEPWEISLETEIFNESIDNPYEVIIKNKYSHISAGTEMACISDKEDWFTIPDTPGYTSIGEVLEMGDEVEDLEKGDLVYTMGPHAEYFKIDTRDRWHGICVRLPDNVNQEYASFTHMAGIAMTALRRSNIELGDDVLVAGLGVIGNLAAQFAQLQGANVIAVDLVDERIKVAEECGINNAINPQKVDVDEEIDKLTNENGVSTFIDATGVSKVIEQYANNVSSYGEIILLGSPRAEYQTNLTDFLQKIHLLPTSATAKGALEFTYPTHENEFVKHSITRNSKIILKLINDEKIAIEPFYTHKMNPSEAQQAYEGLRDNPSEYMGVVFDWTE
jgi:hypothetical protein